ncbi:MAG: S8 family serine peptidase [Acidobacteria bacterium]|nr:S8 family serine peptidase [Acidobacteriota bacterium]
MATRRIAAYFLDPEAREAALRVLGPSAHITDAFVYGEADESGLSQLEAAGLIVQPHDLPPPRPLLAPTPPVTRGDESFSFDSIPAPAELDYYAIRLNGPLMEPWRAQLDSLGVSLLEALPSGAFKARLHLADVLKVSALGFVSAVDWITPAESSPRVQTVAVRGDSFALEPETPLLSFDLRLHSPDDRAKVEQWIRDRHLGLVGVAGRKIRFKAFAGSPELDDLAALAEVDTIAEFIPPKLKNDIARLIVGVDAPAGNNPSQYIDEDGSGQIVAVADTGIDDQHPDFQGRIVGRIARGRKDLTNDPDGHGTHCAGSILGDGAASQGKVRGMAPAAKLFFQSVLDDNDGLGGLPLTMDELLEEAYQAGARIHSDSWCSETGSSYQICSEETDEYVRKRPDMLVVMAAGNEGKAAKARHADKGFVDWLSIGSPSSCKNALTVGASRSHRADGPDAACKWSEWDSDAFPDAPIANEIVAGDPESLAAFSSRGPCDDFRIKPDLVAPGTDIASTRSSLAPIANFWGPYPASGEPNPKYAYDGGTSMATPIVAGCATLVRQYFVDKCQHQPSAALLKATLVNGAVWLKGADANAPKVGVPNYHQGHGRVDLSRAIPNRANPNLQVRFADDWSQPAASFTRTGERRRYQFTLSAGVPELRVTLAYTDVPGRALQNNLDLIVQHRPTGRKWTGNSGLPDALTPLDATNNVEKVSIDHPPAGDYVIQVVASNLLKPPQDFALVVAGDNLPLLARS